LNYGDDEEPPHAPHHPAAGAAGQPNVLFVLTGDLALDVERVTSRKPAVKQAIAAVPFSSK
jgi:hypothetical protein